MWAPPTCNYKLRRRRAVRGNLGPVSGENVTVGEALGINAETYPELRSSRGLNTGSFLRLFCLCGSNWREVLAGLGQLWLLLPGQAERLHPLQQGQLLLPLRTGGLQQTPPKKQPQVSGFDTVLKSRSKKEDNCGGDLRQHDGGVRVGVESDRAEEGGHSEN